MSQIRKAHSVEIIDRRLRQSEMDGVTDLMELVGLHDELSRVERKWLEKLAERRAGKVGGRPLSDPAAMNARFERLARLVAATLRRHTADSAERQFLQRVGEQLARRQPV